MFKVLMEDPDIDPNVQNDSGEVSLHWAIKKANKGDLRYFDLLIAHPKLAPNTQDENGWAPLHQAVCTGNLKAVAALLDHPQIDTTLVATNKEDLASSSRLTRKSTS